jgi:excisionase family DNA binding protein
LGVTGEPPEERAEAAGGDDGEGWLSLGEAARQLGVSQGTLRRWADRGQIASFTTPGGHRRFPRTAIVALLPAGRQRRPSLAALGASSERMSAAYRRLVHVAEGRESSLVARLTAEHRETYRERGRRMVECLIAHLDADEPAPAIASLHEAETIAVEYGAEAARLGASLSEGIETFLRFRAPFIEQLAATARRRGLDTREATGLLVDAEQAFDQLLLAFMEAWQHE